MRDEEGVGGVSLEGGEEEGGREADTRREGVNIVRDFSTRSGCLTRGAFDDDERISLWGP